MNEANRKTIDSCSIFDLYFPNVFRELLVNISSIQIEQTVLKCNLDAIFNKKHTIVKNVLPLSLNLNKINTIEMSYNLKDYQKVSDMMLNSFRLVTLPDWQHC